MFIGILLFYIGGVTIIGLLVPYTSKGLNIADGTAASSPFVIAIQNSGIKALPSVHEFAFYCLLSLDTAWLIVIQIINACLLTSAWSAASSDLYTSSRALCMC
jgi:amino acid transporter